jgi:hypothetical protein
LIEDQEYVARTVAVKDRLGHFAKHVQQLSTPDLLPHLPSQRQALFKQRRRLRIVALIGHSRA